MDSARTLAQRAQVDRFFREHHESVLRDAAATLRKFPALAPFLSAEDLLHETYLAYVWYVESGRAITWSGEAAFRKVTLRRKAIDHLRSGRRREAEPIDEDLPQEQVEQFEGDLIDRVVAALAGLRESKPIYFELLHLSFFLGLRVQEIAGLLGERENTISVRKRRALAALKCEMAKIGVRMPADPAGDDDPDGNGSGPGRGTARTAGTRGAGTVDVAGTRGVLQVAFGGTKNLTPSRALPDDGGPDAQRPGLLCLEEDLFESLLGLALATRFLDRTLPHRRAAGAITAPLAAAILRRAAARGWRARN